MDALELTTDKFTAARIRLFQATGMAKQRSLPFDRRPKLASFQFKPAMLMARRRTPRMPAKVSA